MAISKTFRDKYRIASARNPMWDYTGDGSYFITVCTDERRPWFGYVRNGTMCVSNIGAIVDDEWKRTACIRPYVTLDQYVVMPDHFHGIITIRRRDAVDPQKSAWAPGCLGVIIHQFKRACTMRIRSAGHPDFTWQPRFHDRIIRNEHVLNAIRTYIIENPKHGR